MLTNNPPPAHHSRVTVSPMSDSNFMATAIHSQSGNNKIRTFSGSGSDGDVVVASARAYVSAINKMITWNKRRAAQAEAEEGAAKSAKIAAVAMEN